MNYLIKTGVFACGALAASISVGIVIPSTWFVYFYNNTVSITVVVMGTKQFNDKTIHRQQFKTGFVRKWENRSPGLFQDFFIFQRLDFFLFLYTTTFKRGLFACGALAASISVGIVIPSTWFVYLYKQTVRITVVVMGTKQFSDKTTHRQQYELHLAL